MPAGRPASNEVDRLVAFAQLLFLRESFDLDVRGTRDWLRNVPAGAMNDRDITRFLQSRSQLSPKKAAALDEYIPGLKRVTSWPWRCLAWSHNRPSGLQESRLQFVQALVNPDFKSPRNGAPFLARFSPLMSWDDWIACEGFFSALIDYRIEEADHDTLAITRKYSALMWRFDKARSGRFFEGLAQGIELELSNLLPRNELARQLIIQCVMPSAEGRLCGVR